MAVHSLIRDDLLVTDADTVVRSSGSIEGSGLAGLLITGVVRSVIYVTVALYPLLRKQKYWLHQNISHLLEL